MSFAIEAPPERPGHVGHTPQPAAQLGMRAGRLGLGGIFDSTVVRAILGLVAAPPIGSPDRRMDAAGPTEGIIAPAAREEYAAQPFGIPGGKGAFRSEGMQPKPKTVQQQALAHAHTVLALEESVYKLNAKRGYQANVPDSLRAALDDMRTWKAPR